MKRNIITVGGDYDFTEYLIPTNIYEEDKSRFERLFKRYEDANPDKLGSFHCYHEHDCCGCLCSRYAEIVAIFGRVYIAVTESRNY